VGLSRLASPSVAGAQTSEPIQLSYQAPEGCPDEAAFRRRVEERLTTGSLESVRRAPPLVIRVTLRPESSNASVLFDDADPGVERHVTGDSCDELASAAALILAVTLTAPSNELASPPAADRDAPEGDTGLAKAAPAAPGAMATPPPAPSIRPAPSASSGPRAVPAASTEWSWQAGAGGFLATWPLGTPRPGGDLFARVGGDRWSGRVGVLYLGASVSAGERSADFSLLGGRVEGCPLSTGLGTIGRFELCLLLELGSLSGEGDASSALANSGAATVFWSAVALPARLRVAVGSRLHLETQAEVAVPLSQRVFVFERPREEVARAPAVGFSGRIGLGVTFL
jgi:hypothetical protein